jgi:hypothetical protein
MPDPQSQRDHPLNRRASELLKQLKVRQSSDLLPLVKLVVEALDDRLDDLTKSALYRLDPETVMRQVSPLLTVSDLENLGPEEAAEWFIEALGLEELVSVPQ